MTTNENSNPDRGGRGNGEKRPELKFVAYNVAMTLNNERITKKKDTRWETRRDRIYNLLSVIDADVMCLHGLNRIQGSESPEDFLKSLEGLGYDWHIGYADPEAGDFGQANFGQAILWKRENYQKMKDRSVRIRNDASRTSRSILTGCKLRTGSEDLWILNSDIRVDEKTFGYAEDSLASSVENLYKGEGGGRFLLALNGEKPKKIPGEEDCFHNLAMEMDMLVSSQNMGALPNQDKKTRIEKTRIDLSSPLGTFVGYSHNPEKEKRKKGVKSFRPRSITTRILLSPGVLPKMGPVVHTETMPLTNEPEDFFGSTSVDSIETTMLSTKEPEEFSTRDFPSEHLPVSQHVLIQKKKKNLEPPLPLHTSVREKVDG